MEIGIFKRNWGKSYEIYQDNVCRYLKNIGVIFQEFDFKSRKIPENCDVLWTQGAPIVDTIKVLAKSKLPLVTTIHGVNQFVIPSKLMTENYFSRFRWEIKKPLQSYFWRRVNNKFSAFITVSDYCKNKIIDNYKIPAECIHSIYHGYNEAIFNEEVAPYVNDRPYFLHISTGKPIKNIERLCKAFLSINKINIDLLLVAPLFKGNIINHPRIKFISKNKFLSQFELASLYRGALCFVFPSLDETFGLPILEAMACGCPVITSNLSACPEIVDKAAILVDPFNVGEITDAMQKLIEHPEESNRLIELGRKQRTKFSWEKSAKEHLNVFRGILSRRR